ncbi:hypothetical protein MMA231_02162 [Asticcacaulis sp. MM231]|uniref:DUF6880 family protein n=1 Tax=Asticcacaulis sp. MM231 TaxID=3157666 RepID=UPI0032D5A997
MASKTTLNAKNLEALGAAHLAELLMDISEGNANAKRRLRLELAGSESPGKLTNEIRKRLMAIGAATANVGWRSLKGFRGDLNTQRRLISEQVQTASPQDAAELMWQFIALGDAVIERTSDASGGVVEIFQEACQNIGTIVSGDKADIESLLHQIALSQINNTYGQNDQIIALLAPNLDRDQLMQLRDRIMTAAREPLATSTAKPRTAKRWRKRVLAASESLRKRTRAESVRVALLAIADAAGDVDAFIALMSDAYVPATAAQIANRLLKAERPHDALKALDGARQGRGLPPAEWIEARLQTLEVLDYKDEAQVLRLEQFRQTLDSGYLRAYLKRLPDFDDIEAEDEALDGAKAFPDANAALDLLVRWPSLERAAQLVINRLSEIDGNSAEAVTFAADRLSSRYPLAALLLHRQIVEASLISFSEPAHTAAGLTYLEAESLARHVDDFGRFDTHETWLKKLGNLYGRRTAFWKALP